MGDVAWEVLESGVHQELLVPIKIIPPYGEVARLKMSIFRAFPGLLLGGTFVAMVGTQIYSVPFDLHFAVRCSSFGSSYESRHVLAYNESPMVEAQ